MASAALGQELTCSICLDLYTDPVTLRCGHNFCRVCIDQVLTTQDGSGGYSCPECRAEFQERPALQRNITLCNVVENFRSTHGADNIIFCTYCVDSPVPAAKSCLLCAASLCEKHLRVHSKEPEHVLTDPSRCLEKRKCPIHKKILEYYCTEDATCICVSCCLVGEHRGHNMESLDEASEKKKKKLKDVLQKLQTKRQKTQKKVKSLEKCRKKINEKQFGEAERVTALFIDLRRRLDDLEKKILSEISRQRQKESRSLTDVIQKLEREKEELSRKMQDIEEMCNMTDPLTVLQEPDTGDLYDPEVEEGNEDTGGDDGGDEDRGGDDGGDEDTEGDDGGDEDTEGDDGGDEDTEGDDGGDEDTEGDDGGDEDTEGDDGGDGDTEGDDGGDGDTEGDDGGDGDTEGDDGGDGDTEGDDGGDGDTEGDDGGDGDTEGDDGGDGDTEGDDGGEEDTGGDDGVAELISGLSRTLSDIIRGINVTFYVQDPADISLDIDTAANNLLISDDLKTATWTRTRQNRPDTAERFLYYQVMSRSYITSGRHYWDVEISGAEMWRVGVCYPNIDRRGDQSHIGDNNKSWALFGGRACNNQYAVRHDSNNIQLPHQISSDRVRIYVDYEAGELSFYALCDPIRHLHTFTTRFSEPLHAVLYAWGGSINISGGGARERTRRISHDLLLIVVSQTSPCAVTVSHTHWSPTCTELYFHFLLLLSAMASAALGQELTCSICLDLYTDPVTLRCGHNFCRVCIDRVLTTQDGSGGYSCPECRAEFQERPELQRNITLCNVVENFRADNIVFCTYCVDSPVPALKSCLLCEASLCEKHLRVHSKGPEHVLTDPSRSLEKRKCPTHKKILEYYCTEDATCICVSCCLVGDHRGHNMESLDEASEKKKKKLKDVLQKLTTKRQKTQKKVNSLEKCRKKINEKQFGEAERVTALFIDLRRRLDDLEKKILSEISRQRQKESRSLTDVIQKLEIEKEELSRKMQDIEEMCNMTDPLTVLQEPDTGDLCDPEEEGGDGYTEGPDGGDGYTEGPDGGDGYTEGPDGGDRGAELISGLSRTLSDIIGGINVTFYVQDPADISLDVNTAANNLLISDDLKTATWTLTEQNRPDTAKRFLYYQVMSRSYITSGRHYWDVEVSGAGSWRVGVCYPSIDRKGRQSCIGDNNKSWGLCVAQYNNQYVVRHNSNNIQLPHQISSDRVRIYVDYEEGELSFYELCDPIRHLHTFTTRFTEPLHAVLYVDNGSINISGGGARERTRRM
ncbi:uncharacterized protein [Engystomops pustulosus]|uniref:uncharacterized protein n=1 Tax=Engystomops pustulosus TaxID=76066 RepID=UPI003AFA78E7